MQRIVPHQNANPKEGGRGRMVKGGGANPQNAKESKKSRLVSRLFVASMGESSEESGVSDNILCTKPSKPTLDALLISVPMGFCALYHPTQI